MARRHDSLSINAFEVDGRRDEAHHPRTGWPFGPKHRVLVVDRCLRTQPTSARDDSNLVSPHEYPGYRAGRRAPHGRSWSAMEPRPERTVGARAETPSLPRALLHRALQHRVLLDQAPLRRVPLHRKVHRRGDDSPRASQMARACAGPRRRTYTTSDEATSSRPVASPHQMPGRPHPNRSASAAPSGRPTTQ